MTTQLTASAFSRLNALPSPNPYKELNTWCFSIQDLDAKKRPLTHTACAEIVDTAGDYRGISLGEFTSRQAAENAVSQFKPTPAK